MKQVSKQVSKSTKGEREATRAKRGGRKKGRDKTLPPPSPSPRTTASSVLVVRCCSQKCTVRSSCELLFLVGLNCQEENDGCNSYLSSWSFSLLSKLHTHTHTHYSLLITHNSYSYPFSFSSTYMKICLQNKNCQFDKKKFF